MMGIEHLEPPSVVEDAFKVKKDLWTGKEDPSVSYSRLLQSIQEEVAIIQKADQENKSVIPEISFEAIDSTPTTTIQEIKKRGCVVVRGTVGKEQAERWAQMAEDYVTKDNNYAHEVNVDADKKNFFAESTPQIYGVYWGKAQIQARQHENVAKVRSYLNRLWSFESNDEWSFDPDKECSYADRQRIRQPGNISGLAPHVDGGSVERWVDPGYVEFYKDVYNGNWESFDPWNGVARVRTEELPSPNVCTVFRTYQGWLALSKQGKNDGTLQVVPLVKQSTAHLLLKSFQQSVDSDDPFCGAFEGRQFKILEKYHAELLKGLISIPEVQPGDMVFWHPDLIHAVEREHKGNGKSSVLYIGGAPLCKKNALYVKKQKKDFLNGEAGPDFPQEHKEVDYNNRASVEDLTDLGKKQMGFEAWDTQQGDKDARIKLLEECSI
ncbi:hypothetical protein AKO1_013529 [Acrasis kona]|uniref:DUF1479-domain-containing protein n=1 Tax=Acrasis kona TaxID=1008807 RepID=A0AAW2ZG78_9EUKA